MKRYIALILIIPLLVGFSTSARIAGRMGGQVSGTYFDNTPNPLGIEGLTFYKDFTTGSSNLNADYSIGSPLATFTATRSATAPATYIDSNGIIQLVTSSNTPRYAGGYYDETGFHSAKGLMIEVSRTNFLLNTYFSLGTTLGTSWSKDYGTATLETCAINGISGGKSQKIIHTFTGEVGRYSKVLNQVTADDTFDVSAGNIAISVSFWARGDLSGLTTGTSSNKWLFVVGESNDGTYRETAVSRTLAQATTDGLHPTEWRYFKFSGTLSNVNTRQVSFNIIYTDAEDGSRPTTGESLTFEVYGVQIEKAPYPTSFIPTTTAALTRGAETLKYPIAGNRTAAQETIAVQFMPLGGSFANDGIERDLISTDTKNRVIRKASGLSKPEILPNATDNGSSYSRLSSTATLLNTIYIFTGISYSTSGNPNSGIYCNGVDETSGSYNTDYNLPVWGTYFYLGSSSSGTSQLNGLIQKVAIWNRPQSSGEVLQSYNNLNQG